jgi:hypothetical protein
MLMSHPAEHIQPGRIVTFRTIDSIVASSSGEWRVIQHEQQRGAVRMEAVGRLAGRLRMTSTICHCNHGPVRVMLGRLRLIPTYAMMLIQDVAQSSRL